MMTERKARGMSAWLVTWEHMGDHAKPPETVAAVLSPRLSGRRVAEIVELLYANASYDPSERIAIARARKQNPYPGRYGTLYGVPWEGEITCGHNPWLEARLVNNLRAEKDAAGIERFAWEERPKPSNWILEGQRQPSDLDTQPNHALQPSAPAATKRRRG